MANIKIIGRIKKNKNLFFCDYSPALDTAINNFKGTKTVRVLWGKCFISFVSLGYFTEILSRDNVPFTVITTLN